MAGLAMPRARVRSPLPKRDIKMSEEGGTVYASPRVLTEGEQVSITAEPDSSIPDVRCSWVGYSAASGGSAVDWNSGASWSFTPAPGDYYPMAAYTIGNGPEETVYGSYFSVAAKPQETIEE